MGVGVHDAGMLAGGAVECGKESEVFHGMWFGIATSKYQFSVAPSTPFDGLLLKDPRLMHLEVQGCASWGAEGRDVLAGGVIGLAAILR